MAGGSSAGIEGGPGGGLVGIIGGSGGSTPGRVNGMSTGGPTGGMGGGTVDGIDGGSLVGISGGGDNGISGVPQSGGEVKGMTGAADIGPKGGWGACCSGLLVAIPFVITNGAEPTLGRGRAATFPPLPPDPVNREEGAPGPNPMDAPPLVGRWKTPLPFCKAPRPPGG